MRLLTSTAVALVALAPFAAPGPHRDEAESRPACSVTIRWQTSAAEVALEDSKVRVRGLPWVRLGAAWGQTLRPPSELAVPYTDQPGNSLFYTTAELNQDCDRYRRYRFKLVGKDGTRFEGLQREFYFPRENGYTTTTNLDLGYLDLCMADGHECAEPYYPGGNETPLPSGPGNEETTRTQSLEGDPGSATPPGSGSTTSSPTVDGQDLAGDWVRTESNYNPNNGMRITLAGAGATLTVVPSSADRAFRVGQVLWQSVGNDGTLQVRGNDGNYYDAQLTVGGPDQLDLDVHHNGPGNDQTWWRAGPSIEGEWVRLALAGGQDDGLKIRVQGEDASIRYLPAEASRGLRTGGRIWRNIRPSGTLEVLGSDGSYHPAQAVLVDENRLRIESTVPEVAKGQIWVRPGAVEGVRKGLAGPVVPPNTPGEGLRPPGDLPSIDRPPATPPPGAIAGACLATSLPADALTVDWGWGLTSPTNDDAREETLGIRELMLADFQGPLANTNMIADLERVQIPGFDDGFSFIWQPTGSRRFQWEEHRDLTSAGLEQQNQVAKSSGMRPSDIEGYEVGGGIRYAGVWVENTDGIGWWSKHDMTGEEYGQASRNLSASGYRIVDMEVYPTSPGLRYAAIWYQSCDNDNWLQLQDMDREDYQMEVDSRGELGFRVVDFESYQTDEGQRYAAVWQRVAPGRAWAVRTDRNLQGFLNYHRQYVDEGLRLLDFESYDTQDGVRYAGVWAENEPRYDYPYKATLDTIVGNYRTTHGIPGISVVVMHADSVLYRRGFGWADSAQAKQAHSGTVYLTASVAKVIGSTIAARLEERGEIDLTSPTSDYIPDLPDHHTHTLEQLLSKTGCVPHYPEATPNTPDTTRVYAFRTDVLKAATPLGGNQGSAQMWADTLLGGCTPGLHYRYSTHGFTYVGAALEGVTGKPIADIIADELTRPFALPSIRLVTTEKWGGFGGLGVPPHDLAQGYVWSQSQSASLERDYENTTWKVLGGGLQTDALDLARFGTLTLNGTIVADTARLWTPLTAGATAWNASPPATPPGVGLGWVVDARGPAIRVGPGLRNRQAAEHGGDGRGAASLIRLYRDGGLVIAILTNQQESSTLLDAQGNPAGHPVEGLATNIAGAIFSP